MSQSFSARDQAATLAFSAPDPAWRPQAAPLSDPLYYLANFDTVVAWVGGHHSDLLLASERQRLVDYQRLPVAARALLVRLVMRTGSLFRVNKLAYPELEQPVPEALETLIEGRWLDPEPVLDLTDCFRLLTRGECLAAFEPVLKAAGLPRSVTKKAMLAALAEPGPPPAPLKDWWPATQERVVALEDEALFERLRLMFFGNLRQGWSEFVMAELGHQMFEPVAFTPESRAFHNRDQVSIYLAMQACRDDLEAGLPVEEIWLRVPPVMPNAWLESRRGRLMYELGRLAERGGNPDLALQAYGDSGHREARLRQLRLLERQGNYDEAYRLAQRALAAPRSESERRGLVRLLQRLARKLGVEGPDPDRAVTIPTQTLTLPRPASGSVEWAVLAHLDQPEAPVVYVENTLLNGLFALLCWPALYTPLPGAFFHPFHTAPADLYREDFVARRAALFEQCLAALEDGSYRQQIRARAEAKRGVTSPFLHWPVLQPGLLELALDCLPADHLKLCFQRMLEDLKNHRSGLPDLIRFLPRQRSYEMIEVKGPGDRLQDHQRQWLEFGLAHGMAMSVCHVRWQEQAQ